LQQKEPFMTDTAKIALVLGVTGGIGNEVARHLLAHGWRVRALHRDPAKAASGAGLPAVEWRAGDAMNAADVAAAASGVAVIVHAVNPPGYRNWAGLVLPMLESTLAAAKASGARVLLPGTIYNYAPEAFPLLTETTPQAPRTRKGRIRVEMERRLAAAAKDGTRVLIVRAGDFFGPRAGNNWFAQMAAPGKPLTRVLDPGKPGVGHSWAYLPDLAEAMVLLLEREEALAAFELVHFEGHWLERGDAMAEAIQRAAGGKVPIRRFPWWSIPLAMPFSETLREVWEMRYLWRLPARLDNTRLRSLLGGEPHTPLDAAVRESLGVGFN
jgi:nucleoside-diphosphate-sugar epimerase